MENSKYQPGRWADSPGAPENALKDYKSHILGIHVEESSLTFIVYDLDTLCVWFDGFGRYYRSNALRMITAYH
jgi:hypothetical protein